MRIGELSRRTGVPVPTVKYYVREGLLPAGELTSPNQAHYGDRHERRLRLIRALLDVGGLSVAAVRDVVAAVDDTGRSVHEVLGEVTDPIVPRCPQGPDDEVLAAARDRVRELVDARGWRIDEGNLAATALAETLAALERAGHGAFAEVLDDYADAADRVAEADLDHVAKRVALDDVVESVVVGTVLGDAILTSLRRMAQTHRSSRLFGDDGA
ncbi:MerR family transcriptional regulator [Streptomyces sp. t39]|uniref:MerR family transcriptional regulator n=1 Tax=Streptomyces sp. t39 TaxID=1828156 RepID=UPI0011CE33A3|nr:MerR family transcriptional regulator [Streptomyces sp. t39]TXS51321.1 MerR family transcriptional regulator [Streptomyces sp. t39]